MLFGLFECVKQVRPAYVFSILQSTHFDNTSKYTLSTHRVRVHTFTNTYNTKMDKSLVRGTVVKGITQYTKTTYR